MAKVDSINSTGEPITVSTQEPESWKTTMLMIADAFLGPSVENKMCQKIYHSNDNIHKEKHRQILVNRFIIHPFSRFRSAWDLIMVITLGITLFSLPLLITFYDDNESTFAIDMTIDCIFIIDIIINCRTAFVCTKTEEVVLENKRILLKYIKSWLLIDLISSIPFDHLYIAISGPSEKLILTLRVLGALRAAKLLSLLKFLRTARLFRYVYKLEEMLKLDFRFSHIFNLILAIVLFIHWNGCCQYMVVVLQDFPKDSWVVLDGIPEANLTVGQLYLNSVFRACSHMISIGFGQTPPASFADMLMTFISMSLGATFYAMFIAHISSVVMSMNLLEHKFEEKVGEVREYLRFRRVPLEIQRKVLGYYEHRYQKKFIDETFIFDEHAMSPNLRREMLLHRCEKLVQKVPFLADAPNDFVLDIIANLQYIVFFPGDVIVQGGTRNTEMYFVEHGKVNIVMPNGKVVNQLGDGTYFGEISLLTETRRVASVVAEEICEVYQLTREAFDDLSEDYPELRVKLMENAKDRLQQLEDKGFNESEIMLPLIPPSQRRLTLHELKKAGSVRRVSRMAGPVFRPKKMDEQHASTSCHSTDVKEGMVSLGIPDAPDI